MCSILIARGNRRDELVHEACKIELVFPMEELLLQHGEDADPPLHVLGHLPLIAPSHEALLHVEKAQEGLEIVLGAV